MVRLMCAAELSLTAGDPPQFPMVAGLEFQAVRVISVTGPLRSMTDTTGAPMKLSISYKRVESQESVEKDVRRHVDKLNKLLKSYSPDLVQLHGVFAVNAHKEEQSCTLNLSLPTGSLHATGIGKNVRASFTTALGG